MREKNYDTIIIFPQKFHTRHNNTFLFNIYLLHSMSSQAVKKSKTTLPTVPHLIVKTEEFAQEKTVTQEKTVVNEIPTPTNTSIEAILANVAV